MGRGKQVRNAAVIGDDFVLGLLGEGRKVMEEVVREVVKRERVLWGCAKVEVVVVVVLEGGNRGKGCGGEGDEEDAVRRMWEDE